jgi:hypothetical protein
LRDGVHEQMRRQQAVGPWPTELERLAYQSLSSVIGAWLEVIELDTPDPEVVH